MRDIVCFNSFRSFLKIKNKNKEGNMKRARRLEKQFVLYLERRIERRNGILICPGNFIALAIQAINDLTEGKDRYTGDNIDSPLTRLHPIEYEVLRGDIPRIAYMMFPHSFYFEVRETFERRVLEAPREEIEALRDM